jgi:hypothetical protein
MKEVRTPPTTIAEYIAGFPHPVQLVLKRVRSSIRKALPQADYSIYPANARLVAAFKRELAPYEFNG